MSEQIQTDPYAESYRPHDSDLEMFYERANLWQQLFNELTEHEDAPALIEQAVAELDAMYPYFGRSVYSAGKGIFPLVDEEGRITGCAETESEGMFVEHRGFNILLFNDDEDGSYRIMHQLLVGEEFEAPFLVLNITSKLYAYLDLDSTILPVDEMDQTFNPFNPEKEQTSQDKLNTIYNHSKKLVQTLRSTEFRRLKQGQQARLVDRLLSEADKAAEIRELQILAEPNYGYLPLFSNGTRHFVPVMLDTVVIGGTCMGLDSIETGVIKNKAIRRDTDMADKFAGLCLVIDPDEDTREGLRLTKDQVIYVPTYDQTFEATFLQVM